MKEKYTLDCVKFAFRVTLQPSKQLNWKVNGTKYSNKKSAFRKNI